MTLVVIDTVLEQMVYFAADGAFCSAANQGGARGGLCLRCTPRAHRGADRGTHRAADRRENR